MLDIKSLSNGKNGIRMTKAETVFLELLQIALGNRSRLSEPCSDAEWEEVYSTVKKQAMVGITFYAVKLLPAEQMAPKRRRYQWAMKVLEIEERNKKICYECQIVTELFDKAGYQSCVLKGQSNLFFYPASLRMMRQPGDIDLWVFRKEGDDHGKPFHKREIIDFIWKKMGKRTEVNLHHTDFDLFPKTLVEVHFVPSFAVNPFTNRKYYRWFEAHKQSVSSTPANINILDIDFCIVFQMMHIYRHLLLEGIGFRQLTDLYFSILFREKREKMKQSDAYSKETIFSHLCYLGMERVTRAVMWILHNVLGMEEKHLICEPSEKYGMEMLGEMMRGGNFGQHFKDDDNDKSDASENKNETKESKDNEDKSKAINGEKSQKSDEITKFEEFIEACRHGFRLIMSYPSEVLWIPYLYIKASIVRNYWRRQ